MAEPSKPQVHLLYFSVQGVAETARYVMAAGGLEYTDAAWPLDFSKFAGPASLHKADGPCPAFFAASSAGELDANMKRAPVLVVDGKYEIPQSKAIERYLAKKVGLMGGSDVEAAQIDGFVEHVRDIKDKYQKAKADEDAKAKYFAEEMPELMGKFEAAAARVSPGAGPALVGKSLSLADITLFNFITDFFDDKESASSSISKCPRLQASVKAVGEHPGIISYCASRTSKAT